MAAAAGRHSTAFHDARAGLADRPLSVVSPIGDKRGRGWFVREVPETDMRLPAQIMHLQPEPSPREAAEIKHTCARCDLETKYVGVNNIEAYVSARLHNQDITFKWPPSKPHVERRVSRFAE